MTPEEKRAFYIRATIATLVGAALIAATILLYMLNRPSTVEAPGVPYIAPMKTYTPEERADLALDFTKTLYNFTSDTAPAEYKKKVAELTDGLKISSLLTGAEYANCLQTKCDMNLTASNVETLPNTGQYLVSYTDGLGNTTSTVVSVNDYGKVTAYTTAPISDE